MQIGQYTESFIHTSGSSSLLVAFMHKCTPVSLCDVHETMYSSFFMCPQQAYENQEGGEKNVFLYHKVKID